MNLCVICNFLVAMCLAETNRRDTELISSLLNSSIDIQRGKVTPLPPNNNADRPATNGKHLSQVISANQIIWTMDRKLHDVLGIRKSSRNWEKGEAPVDEQVRIVSSSSTKEDTPSSKDDSRPLNVGVPPYMMQLYNQFAYDRQTYPEANIVRSFLTEGTRGKSHSATESPAINYGEMIDHAFVYNITIPAHEKIIGAHLRTYIIVRRQGNVYPGGIARFVIYNDRKSHVQFITSRVVIRQISGWETFDLNHLFREVGSGNRNHLVRLIVNIHVLLDVQVSLDIDISHRVKFEPLLVVHSDDEDYSTDNEQTVQNEHPSWQRTQRSLPSKNSATVANRPQRHSNRRRNSLCRRYPMEVVFRDIGWGPWVVAPPAYEAFECSGRCVFPLTGHWSPTRHSIVQSLVHEYNPRVAGPCCVPTELSPISMLYLGEGNVPTYKYRYEGMIVSKCGCR